MKPRIMVLTPAIGRRGGGVSEAARLFVTALLAEGRFAPEVVTLRDGDFEADRANWPAVPIHAFRFFGPSNYGFSPGMLLYVLRNRGAAAVHVHGIWMFHVFCAALWCKLCRRPAVVTPHGMLETYILKRSPRLKAAVSWLYQSRFLTNAAALHVLTDKETRDVAQAGMPTLRCHVIPNYVVPPPANPGPPDWWQDAFNTRRIFLFFGRIHDKKGWRELCAAWETLNEIDPSFRTNAQLVFCGWPDACPTFEPTVAVLARRFGNVLFAGPQFGIDRDRSMAAADVFLLPSKSEGLPMAVLEAWATSIPAVMTRACNLDQGFTAGAAVETREDAEAIATALRTVQDWPADRLEKAGTAARDLVATEFSQRQVGHHLAEVFDQVISTLLERVPLTRPLDSAKADTFTGAPSFAALNRIERAVFSVVWLLFASWTPPPMRRWRLWLLRRFGANIAVTANVYGSARIWLPRNLSMEAYSALGPGVQCYCMAPVHIGRHAVVSQRAHLCSGTHDIRDARFQLRVLPIDIGDDAWICAEAFVGPGVKVGQGAILAARAVAFSDLNDWTVYRGNPAAAVKLRPQFQRSRS